MMEKHFTPMGYEAIANLPSDEAEAALNLLSTAEQASVILMTPWERRNEIILLSHDARKLVQTMPVQELFWTIKATGPQDSLHLLDMATPAQLQFFFDLDWWDKAELKPGKIVSWILLMYESGKQVVPAWMAWVAGKDETILPAFLRMFIRVFKRPDEMDVQEAGNIFPPFTMDETYYIAFRKEPLLPLWTRFLNDMFDLSPSLYRDTMETIVWEPSSKNMEDCYRLRNSRMCDHGLPDYYEALDIYAPLPGNTIRRTAWTMPETGGIADEELPAFVPTLYLGNFPLLLKAVERLAGTDSMVRIIREWVGAANKILMADQVDLDDPDALRDSLIRVAAHLNLGLEIAAGSEALTPSETLKSSVLEDLIRSANIIVRNLSADCLRLIRQGLVHENLQHIPDHGIEILRGILSPRPLMWDRSAGNFRSFSSLDDIRTARDIIRKFEAWGRLMAEILPHWKNWNRELPWNDTNFLHPHEVNWPTGLLTALARRSLGYSLRIRPVPEERLTELRTKWFGSIQPVSHGAGTVTCPEHVPDDTVEICADFLNQAAEQAGIGSSLLRSMVRNCLADLYQEWENLPQDQPIDGRFVSSIMVSLESAKN